MPISRYLAGGSLTALIKNKEGLPLDIRPIAVGEAMRRLTGKCLCILSKDKAAEFFGPFQLGWHVLQEQKDSTWSAQMCSRSLEG